MSGQRPIRFGCPVCGERIGVPYEYRRNKVKCPKCHNIVQAAGFQLLWPETRERLREYRQRRKEAKDRKIRGTAKRKTRERRKGKKAEAFLDAEAKHAAAEDRRGVEGEILESSRPVEVANLPAPSSTRSNKVTHAQHQTIEVVARQPNGTHRQVILQQVVVESPPTNVLGVAGFVLSVLGFLSCGLLSPIGLVLSFCGMFDKPKGLATAGLIIGFLGSSWLIIGVLVLGLIPFLAR